MNTYQEHDIRLTDKGVQADIQHQPQVMLKLAQNALLVAENLRDNYFKNTATFIKHLRQRIYGSQNDGQDVILDYSKVDNKDWSEVRDETVTFIDGGVGSIEFATQIPIMVRVGSYQVHPAIQQLNEREVFGYYPVIFGDLEGGSKERKDFPDIVRIIAELLGGVAALERTPNLDVLMFHGPLIYLMGQYAGHTPFTESDIDRFLHHYAPEPNIAKNLKNEFLQQAKLDIYPKLSSGRSDEWVDRRLFEPLSWIAFLYRKLMAISKSREPRPVITGVVERGGTLREFSERHLLDRVYRSLRNKNNSDWFNNLFSRNDLTSPKALLDQLGYTDALLLGMILRPGEASESWEMDKYSGLRGGNLSLPGESHKEKVDFSHLQNSDIGFPKVTGFYVQISETTEPIRVEVLSALGEDQVQRAAERCYLYARLLPRYGFPIGLDIVDKYAKVPGWMTRAYAKLIKHHLGVSLQKGEISDKELRRILVESIYMTHRDWLYRPEV